MDIGRREWRWNELKFGPLMRFEIKQTLNLITSMMRRALFILLLI